MKYFVLASGSKGNATVIKGPQTTLLIDLGLSLREYRNRLSLFSLKEEDVFAVLYTHKHGDHLTPQYSKVANGNIYAPAKTMPAEANYYEVKPYVSFMINEFKVTPLATSHDAPHSVGYVFETEDYKVVYMTDTGYISTRNLEYMTNANLYIIEANHNTTMLLQSNRPFDLIQRILSDTGHLANEATAHYLAEIVGPKTEAIVLAHLSEEANTPELALKAVDNVFRKFAIDQTGMNIVTAQQHTPISGELKRK